MVSDQPDSNPERLAALSPQKRALLERLRAQRATEDQPTSRPAANIVVLRGPADGTRNAPSVLVHPVGGAVFCYAELARLLPGDNPVWAVAADELLAGPVTIEALAAHYLTQVRATTQPPALLGGWSFGGVVAYEMARQLRATGQPVPPVVLLDAMGWPEGLPAWDSAHTARVFMHDLVRSGGSELDERCLDPVDWHGPLPGALAAAATRLRSLGLDPLLDERELVQRYQIYAHATAAIQRYRLAPHDGPVTLIRGRDSVVRAEPWRSVAHGPLTVVEVPGDHYAVLRPPVVTQVAAVWPAAAQPPSRVPS